MNALHPTKKSAMELTLKKQWDRLIGKRVEMVKKIGHVINGWVELSQVHVLTLIDVTIKQNDFHVVEHQPQPVHVSYENRGCPRALTSDA
jgi:hypothetical protein